MLARIFPASKIGQLTVGPMAQKRWSQSTRFFGWLPEVPSEPVRENRGKRSAVATPTRAVAAEIEAAPLGFQIPLRDGNLPLKAAKIHVVDSNFGEERHQHVAAVFDGERDLGIGGLDAAAHAAENIQLP